MDMRNREGERDTWGMMMMMMMMMMMIKNKSVKGVVSVWTSNKTGEGEMFQLIWNL